MFELEEGHMDQLNINSHLALDELRKSFPIKALKKHIKRGQ